MTDKYAVIGNPIGHTKSPYIHGSFAASTGQDIDYSAIEGSLDHFADDLHAFRNAGGRGMNVTAPFKLQAFALATERLERAQLAGATNALKFEGDRIVADNFDGLGLTNDIQRNLGFALKGARMLVLGAGGAVRGSLLPFLEQQPAVLVLANRTQGKADDLARQFAAHGKVEGCAYGDLSGEKFDIVINGTSASLRGELPPLPVEALQGARLAYELAYGKGLTPFLRLAQNAGVPRLADGVGMLVEQAAEAFAWWRGVRPDTRAVIDRMTIPLV